MLLADIFGVIHFIQGLPSNHSRRLVPTTRLSSSKPLFFSWLSAGGEMWYMVRSQFSVSKQRPSDCFFTLQGVRPRALANIASGVGRPCSPYSGRPSRIGKSSIERRQERFGYKSCSSVQEELHFRDLLVHLFHELNDEIHQLVLQHFFCMRVGD